MKKYLILSILLMISLINKGQVIGHFNTMQQCEKFACNQKCIDRGFARGLCWPLCCTNGNCKDGNNCWQCRCRSN